VRTRSAIVTADRVRRLSRRSLTILSEHGPRGLVRVARHGAQWRLRRLLLNSRSVGGRYARVVDRWEVLAAAHTQGQTKVADAETRLRALRVPTGAVTPQLNPTVGIVIAVHRDARSLAALLESVRRQTYRHWRCVVVDDASSDDVGAIVHPFRIAEPRLELLRHGAPGGRAVAYNTALRHLDTDLVVFLDADELLVRDALNGAVGCLQRWWHDAAVAGAYGEVVPLAEDAKPPRRRRSRSRAAHQVIDWIGYRGAGTFDGRAVVVRRDVLDRSGGFNESLPDGEHDRDLLFRLLRHGYRFEPSDRLVGAHRSRRVDVAGSSADGESTTDLVVAVERWAELDDALTVGRGAAAPLARARAAHGQSKRVASRIGTQIAVAGSLASLADSEVHAELDLQALPERPSDDLVDAAIDGACRGLGISRRDVARLSAVARDRIERIGRAVATEILARPHEPAGEPAGYNATSRLDPVGVLLAAESVADVEALMPLAHALGGDVRVAAVDLEPLTGCSGATAAWRQSGVDVISYHRVVDDLGAIAELAVCAPTGPVVADLLEAGRSAGIACRVVQVRGRPDALPCSGAAAVAAGFASDERPLTVSQPAADRRRSTGARGWRGSSFPARLPVEDGPLDADSIERMRSLRNRHRGETAVIIGNGPSLNETELELLTDVPTFGVNAIFLANERFPKPITYYVVEDTAVFRDNLPAIKACEAEWKLFPAMYRRSFSPAEVDEHTVFFRMNAGFYGRRTGTVCHPRFSLDAAQRVYCGQSVTIVNLQLAHWMGFQRVVLIGMDFTYRIPDDAERDGVRIVSRSDDPNHFHPDYFGAGKTWHDPRLERVLVNYHLADEIFRATGREIVNSTEGGKLDVFPRMPLREAIGIDG
jgi:hypothetical protein